MVGVRVHQQGASTPHRVRLKAFEVFALALERVASTPQRVRLKELTTQFYQQSVYASTPQRVRLKGCVVKAEVVAVSRFNPTKGSSESLA